MGGARWPVPALAFLLPALTCLIANARARMHRVPSVQGRPAELIYGTAHYDAGGFAPGDFVLFAAGQISFAAGST
jgi:hypothetical protein